MNWGYKILFVYITFVAGILFMVFKSSSQKTDLVTEDYYGKELVYQQRIDELKRTSKLSFPIIITENNNQLEITFPKEFAGKKIKGTVTTYFPSDDKKDKEENFETIENLVLLPVSTASKGMHYIQVSWVSDGLKYYFEKQIIV